MSTHVSRPANFGPLVPRLLVAGLGVSAILFALLSSLYRNREGALSSIACLPLSAGAALILAGTAIRRPWFQTACWLALALVGQAASLQWIDAGPDIHYQHYFSPAQIAGSSHPLVLAFFVFEVGAVAIGIRPHLPRLLGWVRRRFRPWQIGLVAAGFILTGAPATRNLPHYATELILVAFLQALHLTNVILAVVALPAELASTLSLRFDRWLGGGGDAMPAAHAGKLDRFALLAAVWVTLLAAVLCVYSYERHPHIADEVSYLYQAKYFAAGMLAMPMPPVPDAFRISLMHFENDKWYSPFPPGWPAMLALGVLAGVPWLVNPLLGGLNILLSYCLLQELLSKRIARLTIFLLALSPWHVFMAMNYMSHTFSLTCALASVYCLVIARRSGHSIWGFLAGLAAGVQFLIRPLDGVILCGLLGLWALGIGGVRVKWPALASFAAGAAIAVGISLAYNNHLTGDPLRHTLTAYMDVRYGPNRNAMGFGPERGFGWDALDALPGHTPLEAAMNTVVNLAMLNTELFGWSTGSIGLLLLFPFVAAAGKLDRCLAAWICVFIATYCLYWFTGGPDFGPRYWYLILIPCIVLAARTIFELAAKDDARALLAVIALSLIAAVNYFPWRAVNKYYRYRSMRPGVGELARQHRFGRSVVLVRGNEFPDFGSAILNNPVDLRSSATLYVHSTGQDIDRRLAGEYPDRSFWVVHGPSVTGGDFAVVAGPVAAADVGSLSSVDLRERHSFRAGRRADW